MKRIIAVVLATMPLAALALNLEVRNTEAYPRKAVAQTDARALFSKIKSGACYIVDTKGKEVPSQLTADSLLLFMADVPAHGKAVYKVISATEMHSYPASVCGRIYPERADDIAWENETAGYRVYGPATQAKGEKGYGYDIFFKYTGAPVVEELYAAQCSAENWRKADSLRHLDNAAAEAFINSFTYHIDHGKGMDCYAVGPTLGAGVAAPLTTSGELAFPWCYTNARIIDNGPLRFTLELEFAPRTVGTDTAVVEKRLITLDSNALLNRCRVSYSGLSAGTPVTVGFPLRDKSGIVAEKKGIVAYSDPTQGDSNGRAYLGIVAPAGFTDTAEKNGHILGIGSPAADGNFDYFWGFAWDRNNPGMNLGTWTETLRRFAAERPLEVRLK